MFILSPRTKIKYEKRQLNVLPYLLIELSRKELFEISVFFGEKKLNFINP